MGVISYGETLIVHQQINLPPSHLTNKHPPLWEGAGEGSSPLDCAPPATADAPQLLPLQGEPEGVT